MSEITIMAELEDNDTDANFQIFWGLGIDDRIYWKYTNKNTHIFTNWTQINRSIKFDLLNRLFKYFEPYHKMKTFW